MEEKTRAKKTLTFIFVLFLVTLVVFWGYSVFVKKNNNPFSNIVGNLTDDENKILDNYNGIYLSKDTFNGSLYIFSGCNISYISDYILIVNDDYFTYRSSCLGTYPKESGKVKDLNIKVDKARKSYSINYNGKDFIKDHSTIKIEPQNINNKIEKIDLSNYNILIKETQFKGNYYNIKEVGINNISSKIKFNFIHNSGEKFTLKFTMDERELYSYYINDLENLPELYSYGKNIIVIEKNFSQYGTMKYKYNFKVINENGVIYDLYDKFPITVDNVVIDENYSIFIAFDKSNRYFKVLLGYDDKMCVDNSNSSKIVYYEFKVDYNYSTNKFDDPVFVGRGLEKDGCGYIDGILRR